MNSQYRKTGRRVAIVHGVLLALLLGWSMLISLFERDKEVAIPVEFVDFSSVADASLPAPVESIVREVPYEPPAPDPPVVEEPAEIPEPRERVPEPPVEKKVAPPPKKPKINVSRTRVTRSAPVSTPERSRLSPEEIRKKLSSGLPKAAAVTSSSSEDARCFGLIYQILYGAWDQPSREAAGGRQVTARISLDAQGNITRYEIASSSGVPELDDSVTLALRSVKRVPGLTERFLKSHKHLTIAFEVE